METKECTKCKKVKPLKEFNRRACHTSRHRSRCRQCEKDQRRARGLKITQDEEYQITPETMRNHMYLHFGFWESRITAIERDQQRRDVAKYYRTEQKVEHKRDK